MADDVDLPIAAPTVVATDDIGGGRQAQLVKILDGRGGVAIPLGGPNRFQIVGLVAVGSPTYTDGQVVGTWCTYEDKIPEGIYQVRSVTAGAGDGTSAVPDLSIVGYSNADAIVAPADGDTFALDLFGSGTVLLVPHGRIAWTSLPGGSPWVVNGLPTDPLSVLIKAGSGIVPNQLATLQMGLVADGAILTDLTGGGLIVVLELELISTELAGVTPDP